MPRKAEIINVPFYRENTPNRGFPSSCLGARPGSSSFPWQAECQDMRFDCESIGHAIKTGTLVEVKYGKEK
jgi:hypothetical protein